MKKFILFYLIFAAFTQQSFADEYYDLLAQKQAIIEQIKAVESELARCEKTTKGWKVATIVGGVGAVAGGIGLIAQKQKTKEHQKNLNELTNQADELKDELKTSSKDLDLLKGFIE